MKAQWSKDYHRMCAYYSFVQLEKWILVFLLQENKDDFIIVDAF